MHTQKIFNKKLTSLLFAAVAIFSLIGLAGNIFLVNVGATAPTCVNASDPKAVDPECAKTTPITLTNDQAQQAGLQVKSADSIVAQTLNGVYAIVAIVAVVIIVMAGIRIITADGDSSKVAGARQTIIYAVVGLVVVGSAFIITGIVQGVGTN